MDAIRTNDIFCGDGLSILERDICCNAGFGTLTHAHSFIRVENRDSDFLQFVSENFFGDMLRQEDVEGKAGLSNQPVKVGTEKKIVVTVKVVDGCSRNSTFDYLISATNGI